MEICKFFELMKKAQSFDVKYNELQQYLQQLPNNHLQKLLNEDSNNPAASIKDISPMAFAIENGLYNVVSLFINHSPYPACLTAITNKNSLLKLINNTNLNKDTLSTTIKTIIINNQVKNIIPETVIIETAKSLLIRMIQHHENEYADYNELFDSLIASTNYEWNIVFLACVFSNIVNSPLIQDDNRANEFKMIIEKLCAKFRHTQPEYFINPEFQTENPEDFKKLCRAYSNIAIKLINEKKPKLLNVLLQYKIYTDLCINAIYKALENLILTQKNENFDDELRILETILHHQHFNHAVGLQKISALFELCLKNLKNKASGKFINITFDFLIERGFFKKIPCQKKANEALDFYKKKYYSIISGLIKNNNIDGLISLVQAKKNHEQHLSLQFKQVINFTHVRGLTAMDLALGAKNKKLVMLLLECNFDDDPKINHKNNSVNILNKLVKENPDEAKLGLIWTVFHSAKGLKVFFIENIVNYCLSFIKDEMFELFYNRVLDCIAALPFPFPNTGLAKLIIGIHITLSNVDAFNTFIQDYLKSEMEKKPAKKAIIDLRHIIESPFFENLSAIEYVIKHDNMKILQTLLYYHPAIAIIENEHNQIPLLNLLENIATGEAYQNCQKKYRMAKLMVNAIYIKKTIEINGNTFSMKRINQAKNFPMVTTQIIHYAINHLSARDDEFFSELVTIIFENYPDLVRDIMLPMNLTFQNPVSKEISKLFYCDSLLAAAAIKKNIHLYTTLLNFLSHAEQLLIPEHQFSFISAKTKIAVLIGKTSPESIKFPNNSRFLLLYKNDKDFSLTCHFLTTDVNGERINEKKFLVNHRWTYHFHEISLKKSKKIVEKRLLAVINDLHILHNSSLGELIEAGYYMSVKVKKIFSPAAEKEQHDTDYYCMSRTFLVSSPDESELISYSTNKQPHGDNQYILLNYRHDMNISLSESMDQKERYIDNTIL